MKTLGPISVAIAANLALGGCINIDSSDEIADLEKLDSLASREYDVGAFDKIALETDTALLVTMGDEQSVTLYTEEDHFGSLTLEVVNGTLELKHDGRARHDAGVALVVTATDLTGLDVAGAIDGRLRDLTVDDFDVDLSGAANLEISGSCNSASFDMAGAGNIEARDFKCHSIKASMSGAGNVELYADESVDISLAGVGNVEVYGQPSDVKESKAGFGAVTVHGRD